MSLFLYPCPLGNDQRMLSVFWTLLSFFPRCPRLIMGKIIRALSVCSICTPARITISKSCLLVVCAWGGACMHKSVWVYIIGMCMCMHVETRSQPRCGSSGTTAFCFKTGHLTNLECTHCVRMVSQWAPGICLSLPPQYWDYKHVPSCLFGLGSGNRPTQIVMLSRQGLCWVNHLYRPSRSSISFGYGDLPRRPHLPADQGPESSSGVHALRLFLRPAE